jgi:hemerythrin
MPVVQWQDGLRVGNDIIDADHQVTVAQLNTLVDADASEFPRLYAEFFHHLKEHFEREEGLMQDSGFPAYLIHRNEHRRVLAEFERFQARISGGNLAMARAYVAEIVPNWFATHLATMDAATAAYIRQAGAAA